jgi:hypothetical protein
MGYADENCRGDGDKGFHISQGNFERIHLATDFFQHRQRGQFAALQTTRWKHGKVSRQMRQLGMQFPPEVLNKFSDWIPHVSHQGITASLHH